MEIRSYGKNLKAGEDVKAGEFKTYTISGVRLEDFKDDAGKVDKKYVLDLEETELGFPLNATNLGTCLSTFGKDGDKWKGKQIKVTCMKVQFGAKMVDGIRIVG